MDKIIGSEENWEDGRLGLDEENQVVVDEQVDREMDQSLGLVQVNLKISSELNEQLLIVANQLGLNQKAVIRKILTDFINSNHQ